MKIRIVATLDIDPEVWGLEYGVSQDELGEDVRSYVLTLLQGCPAGESGAIASVTMS